MKLEVSTSPEPAANAVVEQVIAITPMIVAKSVAFLEARVSLESHLCLGAGVVFAVSFAVLTAVMFMVSIGKKSPFQNKIK